MFISLFISILLGYVCAQSVAYTNPEQSPAKLMLISWARIIVTATIFSLFWHLPTYYFIFIVILFMLTMWFCMWRISGKKNDNGWL